MQKGHRAKGSDSQREAGWGEGGGSLVSMHTSSSSKEILKAMRCTFVRITPQMCFRLCLNGVLLHSLWTVLGNCHAHLSPGAEIRGMKGPAPVRTAHAQQSSDLTAYLSGLRFSLLTPPLGRKPILMGNTT